MTSSTGLMPSPKKSIQQTHRPPVELSCMITPAPYILRPFAGLYNPFSYGCSILCNHPADSEIKDVVKRAKDALASEYKMDLPMQDMVNIRATLHKEKNLILDADVDFVPEELFRRYTETDSRPLTPAPTLASAVSKGSIRRRCLTPDQPPVAKKTLILDLRRSHSQETLCWHGFCTSDIGSGIVASSGPNNLSTNVSIKKSYENKTKDSIPLISPVTFSTRSPYNRGNISDRGIKCLQKDKSPLPTKNKVPKIDNETEDVELAEPPPECMEEGEIEIREIVGGEIRRRGRRKKGRNRLMSAALINTAQNDPETQIAGIGSESHNASSRGSIVQNEDGSPDIMDAILESQSKNSVSESFLEPEILKYLHREIEPDTLEVEFDPQRRYVLKEVLRTRPERVQGKEMQSLMKEWSLPPVSLQKWLHLPRVFSRRNAIFSLPIDRRKLEDLTPMKYVSNYVKVSSNKQLLYQTVLNKLGTDSFNIEIKDIKGGLEMMMGETMNKTMLESFHSIMLWENLNSDEIFTLIENNYENISLNQDSKLRSAGTKKNEKHDLFAELEPKKEIEKPTENKLSIKFRTWCGLCALCERLNGPLSSPLLDPAHEVELADFDTLNAKLMTIKASENISTVLLGIQNSHINERIDETDFILN